MGNDHYISQFYLKRFGFENIYNPKQIDIYVYFLERSLCKSKSIKNIAYKVNFFNEKVEFGFSIYENQFNKLISKIENDVNELEKGKEIKLNYSSDEIYLLAKFIEFQLRRSMLANPSTKNSVEKKNSEIVEYVKELRPLDFSINEFEKQLNLSVFNAVVDHISNKFFTGYGPEDNIGFIENLLKKNWYIFYLSGKKQHQFITSDFPVYLFSPDGENNGLKNLNSMLFISLTPRILLVNYGYSNNINFSFKGVQNRNFTKDVNKMIASNAIEFLFGKDERLVDWYGRYRNRKTSPKFPKWMTHEINIPIESIKTDVFESLKKHGKLS